MAVSKDIHLEWLCAGNEIFPALLDAINAAQKSVRIEIYTYAPDAIGGWFREALIAACKRGVQVRALVDSVGSVLLPASFLEPVKAAGGDVRYFNPITLKRFAIRNHRKLLVCDEQVAFVGGFNIAAEYDGDGVTRGWCDIGVKVQDSLVAQLAETFDEMFALAEFRYKRFMRFRKFVAKKILGTPDARLLLSGPGRGTSPIKRSLKDDLTHAKSVRIMVAYFLPSWRLRRALTQVARRGGRVQLILPGKSDVLVSQLAGQSLYRRLLRAGIEIYEYQPQILHAKLIVIDDAVYVGSANMDVRSLRINYEMMLRIHGKSLAAEAKKIFDRNLKQSKRIEPVAWRKSRSIWRRLKHRWAYFFLARIDPYVTLRQLKTLRD